MLVFLIITPILMNFMRYLENLHRQIVMSNMLDNKLENVLDFALFPDICIH